jgi:hypothetical protein
LGRPLQLLLSLRLQLIYLVEPLVLLLLFLGKRVLTTLVTLKLAIEGLFLLGEPS